MLLGKIVKFLPYTSLARFQVRDENYFEAWRSGSNIEALVSGGKSLSIKGVG